MAETPSAFPLTWPEIGWPRTPAAQRERAPFGQQKRGSPERRIEPIGLVEARSRLQTELERLRAQSAILSSNVELRLDGQPRADRAPPADAGVAVYIQRRSKPIVFACDRWTTVGGNIAAIAEHLKALRGMERWCVGSIEQLFTGYVALSAPLVPDDWRSVLDQAASLDAAEATYRRKMRTAHPDAGGSHGHAAALNAAIAAARVWFGGDGG